MTDRPDSPTATKALTTMKGDERMTRGITAILRGGLQLTLLVLLFYVLMAVAYADDDDVKRSIDGMTPPEMIDAYVAGKYDLRNFSQFKTAAAGAVPKCIAVLQSPNAADLQKQ